MLQNRQEKPISPQQMFHRLITQSYRQAQCQDQSQKLQKQKILLIQLIQQYDHTIQQQLIRNNQCDQLQRLKLQKLQELDRLRRQRMLIQQSVIDQLARIAVSQGQRVQKQGLLLQLREVRTINGGLKQKIRDLMAYIQSLEQNNTAFQNQKAATQLKTAGRMKVNPIDWRQRVDSLHKVHETHENQLRAKALEKEAQRIKQVRRQQQQIRRRNQARWEQFRKAAFKPSVIPPTNSYNSGLKPFLTRQPHSFNRFRVI